VPRSSAASKPEPRPFTLAQLADRHALYERAVQDPEGDVKFFARTYRKLRGHDPISMREDFCGTAALCCAWARSSPERTAIGVDLSQDTMNWGLEHHIVPAGRDIASRVTLVCDDVRAVQAAEGRPHLRAQLLVLLLQARAPSCSSYFTSVHAGLNRDGVFLLDMLGGTESILEGNTDNDHGDFIYRWEQAKFDAFSHDFQCYIHFLFPDGSKIYRAFSYDWRLWMAPELRDLLLEAGFSKVHFYWEKTDAKGEGTGVFYEPDYVENQEIWWTYIAAER
jgi:hypothetical protein